jgi:photosystem II stability/assembly factor-like uncharacterized protein
MTNLCTRKMRVIACILCSFFLTSFVLAEDVPADLLSALQWRLIGPFRGGRVTSVCGVPNERNVYYMGTPGGGVWKTEDGGRVWRPLFDQVGLASIGALAVAPSDPRIVYVGTGEQTQGNGVYKSTDSGLSWVNVGLHETHIITGLIVDPGNPDIVLVAAAGDHSSGADRGVYKTTDGGKTWQKVLFKDNETGVANLEVAPDNPQILYAALWHRPTDPFNPTDEEAKEQDAAIYRSTDEGSTWTIVEGKGLPTQPMGRVGVAVAPGTSGSRVYAIATQGLFRSDDAGATWHRSTTDPRILGNSYFSRIFIDPKNADRVYVAQTSMYRSTDAGRTFEAWVGAPSGDDFHVLWINPSDTRHMILGVDQGAVISADGGNTWSSWYNQATGQFYHVSTDQGFPYYVYAAQQDSGTAGVPNRSDYGEITYRDWAPVGGFEFAYIEADPLNPNYIYTGGWYGSVLRYEKSTGQVTTLFVRSPKYRTASMAPIAFSPQDPHTIYIGSQFVMKSTDAGATWQEISPDLTQKPPSAKEKPNPRREVITTIAPSTVRAGVMWAGTGNGLVHVTKDLHSWQNVTIPRLPDRASVTIIEASRHDPATAYVVVGVFQDLHPLIYRTHDYGKSWQLTTSGLPELGSARVVREDPERRGLLYAGTTNGVYFSLDDGEHWQSLQLNLPVSPVTDLDVHGEDLVASTFGRALWILDDIKPLRQIDGKWRQERAYLLPPANAVRTRWDMNQDTPLPPETPAGQNPPDGAIVDYFLKSTPRDIKLSIYDSQNNLVREYSTIPPIYDTAPANVPSYWFASAPVLSTQPGLNRFVWDLRYPAPKTLRYGYFGGHLDYIEYTLSDHAIPGETPRDQPQGPLVVPGTYSVVLEVDGETYKEPLIVTLDPRVRVSQADLIHQLEVQKSILSQMAVSYEAYDQVGMLRATLREREKSVGTSAEMKDIADAIKTLDEQAAKLDEGIPKDLGLGPLNRELSRLASMIESSDARPAAPLESAVKQSCQDLTRKLGEWRELNQKKIPTVDERLAKSELPPLPVAPALSTSLDCKQ